MENRLTVYSEDTYEEYRLAWRGAEFCEIVLPRERFGAPGELRLKLENRDGTPAFLPSGAFSLRPARGRRRFPLPAGEGGLYFLTPNGGGRLVLLWETERTPAVRCFAPGPENRLSIGSAPENQFVYDRGNAVSEVHAVFTWTEGGCLLEDRSCNGVYVNGRRVRGSQPLAPGDRVHLCGLTAVYTGNGVALDSSTPGLQVREDAVILEDVPEAFAAGRFLDSEDESESETVLLDEAGSEDETVYEARIISEEKTVSEKIVGSEDETVFEGIVLSEDEVFSEGETVFEGEVDSEGETVFQGEVDSEGETVFEGEVDSEGETVFEGEVDSEGETVYEGGEASEEETVFERPDRD